MGDPAGMIFDPDRPKLGFEPQRHHSDRREKPRVEEFVSSTPERLRSLGIEPVSLEAKEGLALNNGTQVMTAIGILTIFDARNLVASSEGTCAMSFEALSGVTDAFRPELHAARPHAGQAATAAALRRHTQGSQILRLPVNMAFVNAAVRALGNARFHLDRGISPLTDDIAQNVARTLDTIEALQKDPEAPLQTPTPATPCPV